MHKLIINKLGPVEKCELDCTQFMTFTGFQASGKSTIAKAVYYFRTIKEDILEIAKAKVLDSASLGGGDDATFCVSSETSLIKALENHLREKFLRTFGSSWSMSKEMYMEYHFTETCFVKISLKDGTKYSTPNYIWVTLSSDLRTFLQKNNSCLSVTPLGIAEEELRLFKSKLNEMFDDNCSVVYIPAGRSMITLLSQQFSYIYATMDDMQKRSLDSCTKDYLERILRLKPEFSEGLQGLAAYSMKKTGVPKKLVAQALDLIKKILRGTYRCNNGEEQIVLDDGKYVKINFSSSGQQECVWILNLLFYYLIRQNRILFIIEEPESHLFPESQKYITELIVLVKNCGHSVVLTTHSPYVLGTLNNLLYAKTLPDQYSRKASAVIPESLWLDYHSFDSWFVKDGQIEKCMDSEIHMIQNERIDEISKVINADFEKLLELQDTDTESVVL